MNINKLFEGQIKEFLAQENGPWSYVADDKDTSNVDLDGCFDLKKLLSQSFVKFLDIEIERLEKCNDKRYFTNSSVELTKEKIAYLQDIKRQLTESNEKTNTK